MDKMNSESLKRRIKELEEQVHDLQKDLIHDSLTGLKTRSFLEEEIESYLEAIEFSPKTSRKEWFGFKNLSVLFFDVDFFKKINDRYGHAIGDVVLREVSRTISESLRGGDTAARWGGEEIVASLLGANEKDAKNKAEEIRKLVSSLAFDEAPDLSVSISVGVASAEPDIDVEELVKRADMALYKAKESGRNCVVAYSEI